MTRYLPLLLLVLLGAQSALAQQFPLSPREIDDLFDSPPKVEINLRGSLLRLASEATRAEDPTVSNMIRDLRSITVRVYPLESVGSGLVRSIDDLSQRFEDAGWLTLVRVRATVDDDDQEVWVYVRDDGDLFGGLAVMSIDRDEESASFVFIDGSIDPSQVGRLSSRFGNVNVDLDVDSDDDE